MNLTALPDLCLLEIFAHHSLRQQLVNATVCTHFRAVQHAKFRAQTSLRLMVGPRDTYYQTRILWWFNQHLHESQLLLNGGTRKWGLGTKRRFTLNYLPCTDSNSTNSFDGSQLAALLPNIVHLQLGMDRDQQSEVLEAAINLLRHWAPNLVALDLRYWTVNPK